jgi:hypothetical protein
MSGKRSIPNLAEIANRSRSASAQPPVAELVTQPVSAPAQPSARTRVEPKKAYNLHFTDGLRDVIDTIVNWRKPNLTLQKWIIEAVLEKAEREIAVVPENMRAALLEELRRHLNR